MLAWISHQLPTAARDMRVLVRAPQMKYVLTKVGSENRC